AHNKVKLVVAGFLPGANNAGKRTFVCQSQSAVAQLCRAFDQFFGVRGTAQKSEVGQAIKLGVVKQVCAPSIYPTKLRQIARAKTNGDCPCRVRGTPNSGNAEGR